MKIFRLQGAFWGLCFFWTFVGCAYFPKLTILDDPLAKEEHLRLGQAYEAGGQLELAEREYRLAQPLAEAYLALGNLYFTRGPDQDNLKKAENYYRQALTIGPAPAAANNLAWLYLRKGVLIKTAERLSIRAILEGKEASLSDREMDSFKDTLYEIRRVQFANRPSQPAKESAGEPLITPQPQSPTTTNASPEVAPKLSERPALKSDQETTTKPDKKPDIKPDQKTVKKPKKKPDKKSTKKTVKKPKKKPDKKSTKKSVKKPKKKSDKKPKKKPVKKTTKKSAQKTTKKSAPQAKPVPQAHKETPPRRPQPAP
ncbi:MAG: hypothetical protein LBT86_00970 [Deltaproteobacteria bacterium]|nr:hypothetical protein [Deltaproteobacteria bacterium]